MAYGRRFGSICFEELNAHIHTLNQPMWNQIRLFENLHHRITVVSRSWNCSTIGNLKVVRCRNRNICFHITLASSVLKETNSFCTCYVQKRSSILKECRKYHDLCYGQIMNILRSLLEEPQRHCCRNHKGMFL